MSSNVNFKKSVNLVSQKSLKGPFSFVKYKKNFNDGMELIFESLDNEKIMRQTAFYSDNMIVFGRTLSFLRDSGFQKSLEGQELTKREKGIIWRTYTIDYFLEKCLGLPGNVLEVGCYQGTTAKIMTERHDFSQVSKTYYLFDLFGDQSETLHHKLEKHQADFFEEVQARFADHPEVKLIRGRVPESFTNTLPESISFAHIDLNDPTAEAGALEQIFPRLSEHGVIIFDDYGWWFHSDQKIAVDEVAERFGTRILELPTGQGLLIK